MNSDGACPFQSAQARSASDASPEQVTWLTTYDEVYDAFTRAELLQASYDGAKDTLFADVLITLDGPPHIRRRQLEMPLVRRESVSSMETVLMPAAAKELIATLASSGEGDLVEISRLISTRLAAQVVGLDDCDTVEGLEELARLMAKLHEGVVIEWSTRPREQVLAEVAVARDEYRSRFLEPSLRRRQGLASTDRAHASDLIHVLASEQGAHGMDTEGILRESVHFLVATAHTSATVIVHACHEIWQWIAAHPDDATKLTDPLFIQACMNEAMRLWPPSGWQFRVAARDFTLNTGRSIQRGEKLGLDLISANRDVAIFGSDANAFDPYRRLPAHDRGRVAPFGLAFGVGAHVCLGKRLAAGAQGMAGATGVLTAIGLALFAAGCKPHPAKLPEEQTGTRRHQYRTYPVIFASSAKANVLDAAAARTSPAENRTSAR